MKLYYAGLNKWSRQHRQYGGWIDSVDYNPLAITVKFKPNPDAQDKAFGAFVDGGEK